MVCNAQSPDRRVTAPSPGIRSRASAPSPHGFPEPSRVSGRRRRRRRRSAGTGRVVRPRRAGVPARDPGSGNSGTRERPHAPGRRKLQRAGAPHSSVDSARVHTPAPGREGAGAAATGQAGGRNRSESWASGGRSPGPQLRSPGGAAPVGPGPSPRAAAGRSLRAAPSLAPPRPGPARPPSPPGPPPEPDHPPPAGPRVLPPHPPAAARAGQHLQARSR